MIQLSFAAAENDPEFLSPQSFLQESNPSRLSTEADELLFSTKTFPLEEALQKTGTTDPLWFFSQDYTSIKEFEKNGREKLFQKEALFENKILISELLRNAIEASNNNDSNGQKPVNFELRCFPEVSVIRVTQPLSEKADWEKLKNNHSRFSENILLLKRMSRQGDSTLMTNQGVGLDRVGELLQNSDHPGLVRYLRSFDAPNVLVTELYIKSSYSVPIHEKNKIAGVSV